MNRHLIAITLILGAYLLSAQNMRVMSFNIRYDSPQDLKEGNGWQDRKNYVAQTISYYTTDICGLQEALYSQLLDIVAAIPNYHFIGVGRDDGKFAGEFSPILYQINKFVPLDSGHFWLSEQPGLPGKGWDAICCNRIVTWAKFLDKNTQRVFYFFNTHFDHQGVVARRESAHLLKKQIQTIAQNTPVILTGDFNAGLEDEPILILSRRDENILLQNTLFTSATPHFGPAGTFNGWNCHGNNSKTIDHIFIQGPWDVGDHATLAPVWQGRFASDHFAVLTTLRWKD